jgi:hypothetical protein
MKTPPLGREGKDQDSKLGRFEKLTFVKEKCVAKETLQAVC